MPFEFTLKEVAEKYEPVFSKDKFITIQKVYWGKLSNIPLEVAEKLVAMGDNQIKLKQPAAVIEKSDIVKTKDKRPPSA